MPWSSRTFPSLRRRSAFTLLELLIVVGILALLVVLLASAIGRARAAARAARCAGQLHDVTTALMADALERRDQVVVNVSHWSQATSTIASATIYVGVTPTLVNALLRVQPATPAELHRRACPNVRLSTDASGAHAPPPDGAYGSAWVLNWYASGRMVSTIPRPADGVLLFESGLITRDASSSGILAFSRLPFMYPHPRGSTESRERAWDWDSASAARNVAWLDGHVSREPATRWRNGDDGFDADRIRHLRFGLPGTHFMDP